MKKLYAKKFNKYINVILFNGDFEDLNVCRNKFPDIFYDVSISTYNQDLLDKAFNNDWVLQSDHIYLFVMGRKSVSLSDKVRVTSLLNEQQLFAIWLNKESMKEVCVKIEPRSGKHKCYCENHILFHYGCQCGGN